MVRCPNCACIHSETWGNKRPGNDARVSKSGIKQANVAMNPPKGVAGDDQNIQEAK